MKPIVEKVLSSGLVDKATAKMMETWGYLPEGAADKVNEDKLKNATLETLTNLANDLAVAVEQEHALRETYLDLERIKWPASIEGIYQPMAGQPVELARNLTAVVDRMGRYYFRIQDVAQEWFVPGYLLCHKGRNEKILQAQILYVGDQGVCMQVTTDYSS